MFFGLNILNLSLITVFVVVSIIFWGTRFGRSNRWLQFIGMISGLGVSVFVLQFVLENQRQIEQKKKERALNFTVMTERYVINLEKWFTENYPYSTRLYKELYADHPGVKQVVIPPSIDKNRQLMVEAHLCAMLIQAVEDVYWVEDLHNTYASPDLSGWMTTFKRWFSSSLLKTQWLYLKNNYGKPFQDFVDNRLIQTHMLSESLPIA